MSWTSGHYRIQTDQAVTAPAVEVDAKTLKAMQDAGLVRIVPATRVVEGSMQYIRAEEIYKFLSDRPDLKAQEAEREAEDAGLRSQPKRVGPAPVVD